MLNIYKFDLDKMSFEFDIRFISYYLKSISSLNIEISGCQNTSLINIHTVVDLIDDYLNGEADFSWSFVPINKCKPNELLVKFIISK